MSYEEMRAVQVRNKAIELMCKSKIPGLVATYHITYEGPQLKFAHDGMHPAECLVLLEDIRRHIEAAIAKGMPPKP